MRLDEQVAVALFRKWWITVAVISSLLMQLLLLLTGGNRKWNGALRFVAWNAYNWSDLVATTALGSLAQAAVSSAERKQVYALWAPLLLLHLGAPDNISAYARADAELWKRHGLTMLVQVAVAVFVVFNCARSWKFVLLSVCLTALGIIKYAERTYALKRASKADVTESALPTYQYMLAEPQMRLKTKGSGVTLEDILSSDQLKQQTPSVVLLCVGFSFFKLYKRRLCRLYMCEWREEKTRERLFQLEQGRTRVFSDMDSLMFVLDVELRFLFDSLYTKAAGTAFSRAGVIFRILSTILLGITVVFVLGGKVDLHDESMKQARGVTFCLISAALVVEVYQLARLVLSDWCKVWLAWTYIRKAKEVQKKPATSPPKQYCSFLAGLVSWQATAILRLLKVISTFTRHEYWRHRIGQYAMINAPCTKLSTWQKINAKLAGLLGENSLQLLPEYEQSKQTVVKLKRNLLARVVAVCNEIPPGTQVERPDWFDQRMKSSRNKSLLRTFLCSDGYDDFEHHLVNWHIATCLCLATVSELAEDETELAKDVQISSILSRYLMYLMVHKAELLPCHPEMARQLAAETQRSLPSDSIANLRPGMEDAKRHLQSLGHAKRWKLISSVWVDLLVWAASRNKPDEHLEQVTMGGEFLTHLWVLLAHMGCGSQ